jgi:hypothetical protein
VLLDGIATATLRCSAHPDADTFENNHLTAEMLDRFVTFRIRASAADLTRTFFIPAL